MAIAIAALFGWLFSTINVAAPIDRAYAFLYPYVKPYNSTYAWIGVEPREGASVLLKAVEVDGALYPVGKAISGLTWLMPVPCGANVTFLTQYGSASRAETWRVACMNRETTTQMPMYLMQQLIKQFLAVAIDNPAVDFDFDPNTGDLIIHNLNNLTWLVVWSLPNNGVYLNQPTFQYAVLGPNGTIRVPMICNENANCARGLNFYLLYPINASGLTVPLFSTPSPVLKAFGLATPYGVITPDYLLTNASIYYATLSWLSKYSRGLVFCKWVINGVAINTTLVPNASGLLCQTVNLTKELLSTTESGGISMSPWSQQSIQPMLQAYAAYYFERQPYADVYVNGKLIAAGNVVYQVNTITTTTTTPEGPYNITTTATYYETLPGHTAYVYNAGLCGAAVWNFPGTNTLRIGGAKYSVSNLTVIAFGFNCGFSQSAAIADQSFYVTYKPASLNLTLRNLIYVYGNIYAASSNVPCGSMRLTASYNSSYDILNSTTSSWYPIGQVNVYAVNPNCPRPTLTYSGGQILIQFPNSTLSIPAPTSPAYLVTRSLSWSFQAFTKFIGYTPNGQCYRIRLLVFSGNETITNKTVTVCPNLPPVTSDDGSACYVARKGPYDTSAVQSGSNVLVYSTFIDSEICNGHVTKTWSERVRTNIINNGNVLYNQDPYDKNKVCGPGQTYVQNGVTRCQQNS
jgi:hypothetical protein